jgi:hypothetical protein
MADTNNVSTPRADYAESATSWMLVEDACAGSERVKKASVRYLPKPNPKDVSEENRTRYEQYLMRAVYYNAVGRTLNGLVGIAFRRDPEVQLPPALEFAKDDADGAGLSLSHKAQQILSGVMKTGRKGVLVDYPKTQGPTSKADAVEGGYRPVICLYEASDVINWRTMRMAGKTVLSMIVLRESYETDAEWVASMKVQYRVLRLTDGIYTTELWRENPERPDEWLLSEAATSPLTGGGKPWTEIPFTFVGSEDNDVDIDGAPLYDIAVLNLAHYRNSADFEDSAYIVGQPQVYMAGLTESWRDDLIKKGVYLGSRSILPLPVGGTAGIIQAEPNTLSRQAMMDKESQMAALGARLLISTGQVKTATQQDSEDAASHSVLSLCCNNVSAAMTKALGWFATFADSESADISFEINTEFVIDSLDAPTLSALLALVQAGKMPESDLWTQLRNVGLIDAEKTDEEIREEISSQPVSGIPDPFGGAGSGGGNGTAGDGNEPGTGLPGDGNGGNPEATDGTGVPRAAVGG